MPSGSADDSVRRFARERENAHRAARSAERNRPLRVLARAGFAVLGLLHVMIGAIAISVAIGAGGGETDQSGALSQIARTPGGVFVLWTIVIGMAALGVWQVAETILSPSPDPKRKWSARVNDLSKGISYFFIAGLAFVFARGDSASTATATRGFSATLLSTPGGVIVMVVIGLVVVIVGGAFVFRGASRRFTEDVVVPDEAAGHLTVALGATGFIAKGVALAIAGVLFVVGAVTHDPSTASGLDGALKSLTTLPFGEVVLCIVGGGLIAYGIYCLVRAKVARL